MISTTLARILSHSGRQPLAPYHGARSVLLVALGALCGLGTPAHATGSTPLAPTMRAQQVSLAGLDGALVARLGVLANPTLPEAIELGTALARLRSYTGVLDSYVAIDKQSIPALRAAKLDIDRMVELSAAVQASETQDTAVREQMTAVRILLADFGLEAEQVARGTVSLVTDAAGVQAVGELLTRAEDEHRLGLAAFGRNFRVGAARLVRASFLFHGAATLAESQRQREALSNPIDLQPMGLGLPPAPPRSMMPFDVVASVNLTRPAPELTVAVRAFAVNEPAGSPIPPQVTLGTETFRDLPAGPQALPVTVEFPPFTEEFVTTYSSTSSSSTSLFNGISHDIDGNTAVIGRGNNPTALAHAGGARPCWVEVLERNAGGFNGWNEVARINGPDNSGFGLSVALSGNTLVVGAQNFECAYVYERSGQTWTLAKVLRPNDGASLDFFGASVALDGDWIVVGAPGHNHGPGDSPRGGTAYTFWRNAGGANQWGQRDDLAHGLEELNRLLFFRCTVSVFPFGSLTWREVDILPELVNFGTSVAIDGDLLLVGDPDCLLDYQVRVINDFLPLTTSCDSFAGQSARTGAAFVFRLFEGQWFSAPDQDWLGPRPPTGGMADSIDGINSRIGQSVAIADRTLVVGAPQYVNDSASGRSGAAFIYSVPNSAPITLTKKINAGSPMDGDQFGFSLDISRHATPTDPSQMIVVGAPRYDDLDGTQDVGSIYVYVRGHAPGCPTPMPQTGGWGLLARRASEWPSLLGPLGSFGSFGTGVSVTAGTSLPDGAGLLSEFASTTILAGGNGMALALPFRGLDFLSGMEPVLAGQYWLEYELDPFDRILESADDEPQANIMRAPAPVTFCVPALDQPDLAVDSVELDPIDPVTGNGYIVVVRERDVNGVLSPPEQRTRAGLNLSVRMAGMFEGPLTGARVSARAVGQGFDVPFQIWNEATARYELAHLLPDISSGETVSLQLDVELANQGSLPEASGGYPMSVQVSVMTPGGVTENPMDHANNTLSQTGQNLRVLVFQTCNFAQTYDKQLGDDNFGASLDFLAAVNIDSPLPGPPLGANGIFGDDSLAALGASGGLTASASIQLMGLSIKLREFRTLIERDPVYVYDPIFYPGMDPGYQFLGLDDRIFDPTEPSLLQTLYAIGPYDTFDTGELLMAAPLGFSVDTSDGGFRLESQFSIFRGVERKRLFFPGGVPVTVNGRAGGTLGFNTALTASNALRFDVGPSVDFGAAAGFTFGVCSFLCGGAEGDIELAKDDFVVTAALGLQITPPTWLDNPAPLSDHSLGANACFKVTNTLSLLNGKIVVFAAFPWIKWCRRVFGIPVPCGIYIRREEASIANWQGPRITQTLFDKNVNLCCTPVVGFLECASNSFLCD